MRSPFLPLVVLMLPAVALSLSADTTTPAKPVADFTLFDLSGKSWSLFEQKDKKAIVVVFIGTECPLNNAYAPRLGELFKEFSARGVGMVAVNANCHDAPVSVAAHAREYGIPIPVLRDTTGKVADILGAKRTPEAILLDGERRIVYRGRIDDQFGIGFKRVKPTRRDLAEAIEEVLAGKPVTVAATKAMGCLIDRMAKPAESGPITYTKQVSRILQKNCQSCHRPGQVAPMPLQNYEETTSWSDTIREVVSERRMPPWHADPKFGSFSNDRTLTAEERSTLIAWVDGGCPKGDDKDLPADREFPEGWTIGKPDAIYSMQKSFQIPAKPGDRGVEYQYFEVPTKFASDVWVQAAEAKPGNRAYVHHIIVYVRPPKGRDYNDPDDQIGNGFLTGYAPGDMPTILEPGCAKRIPRGSDLVFQMHYTPNGIEGEDCSCVGLIFAKSPPRREIRTRGVGDQSLAIPRRSKNYEVRSETSFKRDVEVFSFMPHMHLRGKDFEYRVVYPNGRSEVVLNVPRYDFNWQSSYRLKTPLKLPAGTRIECTAHFDNSPDNPNNPDPSKLVYWGDQTWDEMMIGFLDYAYVGSRSQR